MNFLMKFLSATLLVYLIVSFVELNLKFYYWPKDQRILFIALVVVVFAIMYGFKCIDNFFDKLTKDVKVKSE